MGLRQYLVDAFTDRPFSGNPAAVCVLDAWPSERFLTDLAMENNLSETAFLVKEKQGWRLRWFTPGTEVELLRARDARIRLRRSEFPGTGPG